MKLLIVATYSRQAEKILFFELLERTLGASHYSHFPYAKWIKLSRLSHESFLGLQVNPFKLKEYNKVEFT